MPFPQEVTPGGVLVYPAVKSPGFVHGSAGWSVNVDGSAEFNNLSIRGTFNGTNFVINSSGEFFYSGTPSLGNLIYSNAPVAGTDALGNAYNPGPSSYFAFDATHWVSVSMEGGVVDFLTAPSAAGPWTAIGQIGNTQNDGSVHLSPLGTASLIADTPLFALNPGTLTGPEAWHDMRPLSNSFVGTISGEYPPQYRMAADGNVELFGTVQTPPSGAYNGITFFTLPTAYRPVSHPVSFPVAQLSGTPATDTTNGFPRMFVDTTGACQFSGISPSINGSNIRFAARFPLNITGLITSLSARSS